MERHRLFFAINICNKGRDSLSFTQKELEKLVPGKSLRFVKPQNLHLTLHFLGNINANKIENLHNILIESCSNIKTFNFSLNEIGCFPNLKHPRVIWIGLNDTSHTLTKVHSSLSNYLIENEYKVEKRPFIAHLTIAYVNKHCEKQNLKIIGESLRKVKPEKSIVCPVNSISLMKSTLTQEGPIYTIVHETKLNQ